MKSLQDITDTWGRWMAAGHSTTMLWTATTNYAARNLMEQYSKFQVVESGEPRFRYEAGSYRPPTNINTDQTRYENNSDLAQRQQFTHSERVERSFHWSTTESISVGLTVSAKVGLPGAAEIGAEVKTELDFSRTEGATSVTERTWEVQTEINIPARTVVTAQMRIEQQTYDVPWKTDVRLKGSVAIWFQEQVAIRRNSDEKHYLWFVPIGEVLAVTRQVDLIDTTGYQAIGDEVLVTASGTFTGAQGVKTEVVVTQTPEALIVGATAPLLTIAIAADGQPAYVSGDLPLSASATAPRPNRAA